MLPTSEETVFFESHKQELMADHAGSFAVICGRRLLGVYLTVESAMGATAEAFDRCNLPEGAPILITQIADHVTLRVMAKHRRALAVEPAPAT